ncbi:MAG: SUMF1/EgtB/PvdO family nonheme iron enzyme [Thermaerobacter sp.]|nr:SUMF1/EgtB/PvdO family nonheme iron enzyme [Thermaerobacter sp.]
MSGPQAVRPVVRWVARHGGRLVAAGLFLLVVGVTLHSVYLAGRVMRSFAHGGLPGSQASPRTAAPGLSRMVFIPAGSFVMGTNAPGANSNDGPAHRVHLSAYYIGRYLVTDREYARFLKATGRPAPTGWRHGTYPPGEGDYPVTDVTWYDATAYARWAGDRLCSEAEWEHAARGPQDGQYPWGNHWVPGRANVEYDVGHPTAVGTYLSGASPYGLYDMAGNVWEWTSSPFTPYPGNDGKNWTFGRWKGYVVTRGGSFMSDWMDAASWQRNPVLPSKAAGYIGFRLCRNAAGGS